MANLSQKDGIFVVRFRYRSKEYKRSLKTRNRADAEAAQRSVEQTIHRLHTGFLEVPCGIQPADFIVSGGTLKEAILVDQKPLPSTRTLIAQFLQSQEHRIAPSYLGSQRIHLRHFERHLGNAADASCDGISHRDLDRFLQARLAKRAANTADKERMSLIQLYQWAVTQELLPQSPAASLPKIKGGSDRPPFRTLDEIQQIRERGGLTPQEELDLWECLYLHS